MPEIGTGTLIECNWSQFMSGQRIRNVFHFYTTEAGQGGEGNQVAGYLVDTFCSEWVDIAVNTYVSNFVDWKNLTGIQEGTVGHGNPGEQPGLAMPVFCSMGVRFNRSSSEVGHGHKRLAGLPDTAVDNDTIDATFITNAQAFIDPFMQQFTTVDGTVWQYVTVSKQYDAPSGEPRSLLPVEEWLYGIPSTASLQTNVTTQISRKIGRGE